MTAVPEGFVVSSLCVPSAGEPGGVCSGRGICLQPNSTTVVGNDNSSTATSVGAFCLCESGWSSIGDLATDPSVDCGINLVAQRAIWGVCALAHVALLCLSLERLYANRHKISIKQVQTRIFGMTIVYSSLKSAAALLEVANDTPGARSIGNDPLTTTLFAFGASGFFIMFNDYHSTLVTVAIRQAKLTAFDKNPIKEHQAKCMKAILPISAFVNVLGCLFCFGFIAGNPSQDRIWGSLHYLCFVVGVPIWIIFSELILKPLREQISALIKMKESQNVGSNSGQSGPSKGDEIDNIKRVLLTLDNTIRELRLNAALNTVVNLLMGLVPLLLRKASYQMPLAWFLIACGALDAMRSLGDRTKGIGTGSSKDGSASKNSSSKVEIQPGHEGSSLAVGSATLGSLAPHSMAN